MGNCNGEDLLAFLRQESRRPHRTLDHHPLLAPLVQPTLGRGEYARALCALYGVQSGLESLLAELAVIAPDLAAIHVGRLDSLSSDLARLAIDPLQLLVQIDLPCRVESVVAVLYLLEGSLRGSRVIAATIERHHGEMLPLAYFSRLPTDMATRWQRLSQLVETERQLSGDPEEFGRHSAAAVELLFRSMATHLDLAQERLCP